MAGVHILSMFTMMVPRKVTASTDAITVLGQSKGRKKITSAKPMHLFAYE